MPTGWCWSDEKGELIDGDQILALIAAVLAGAGRLRGGGVVATVMSNMGLERYLRGSGWRCSGPRWATAMSASGCARSAAISAASSPAT